MTQFHEVRFPSDIAFGSSGGPERRTDVVSLASGHEYRNTRWRDSRRRYNAGYGIKSLADLDQVIQFFEERRGRLYGFRWRDWTDYASCGFGRQISPTDQVIGTGDGRTRTFQLRKRYGADHSPYWRTISKPIAPTVQITVAGTPQGSDIYTCDNTGGGVTFRANHVPPPGAQISAGFEFDVPVRFDTDRIEVSLAAFSAGTIPAIPLIEIRV